MKISLIRFAIVATLPLVGASAFALTAGDKIDCVNSISHEKISVVLMSPKSASVKIYRASGVAAYAPNQVKISVDDAANYLVEMRTADSSKIVERLTLSNILEVNTEFDGYYNDETQALICRLN